jgi:hypothetical protein
LLAVTVVLATWASTQAQTPAALPTAALHHVGLNVVDPAKSQQFYKTIWPQGEITTLAGMPAYKSDMYILLMKVSTLARRHVGYAGAPVAPAVAGRAGPHNASSENHR